MAAKYLFAIIACLFALQVNGLQTVNGKIKITVQTTAGCGDTVVFIRDQLAPTYELYKDFLEVEFVVWGRARRRVDGTVECQFGTNDCWANSLHRCALNMLEGNQDAQVDYMTCEFTVNRPAFNRKSYECALAADLPLVDVDYCVNSNPVDDRPHQIKGDELIEKINFVPSIVFNDEIDRQVHNNARRGLKSMVCSALAADPTTGVTGCDA